MTRFSTSSLGTSLYESLNGAFTKLYSPIGNDTLLLASNSIEDISKCTIGQFICENISSFAKNSQLISPPYFRVKIEGRLYDLTFADDLRKRSQLGVTFIPVSIGSVCVTKRPKTLRFIIPGGGRYHTLQVLICANAPIDHELIGNAITYGLEVTARWLEENLITYLSIEKNRISQHIYSVWRTAAGGEVPFNTVWFVVIVDGHGYFLFDPSKAAVVMRAMQVFTPQGGTNPPLLLLEILNSRLQYEDMNSKKAAEARSAISVDIYSSRFSDDRSTYAQAIAAMVGASEHTIFPVVADGKYLLFAGLPAEHQGIIVPVLATLQPTLAKVMKDHYDTVKQVIRVFEEIAESSDLAWAQKIGTFFGAVAGGFAKSMSEPG